MERQRISTLGNQNERTTSKSECGLREKNPMKSFKESVEIGTENTTHTIIAGKI
jgi:hypothetical protein